MPEQSPSKRWKRGWRPKGAWVFETRDDGTILFFPHGWGRGYVVPNKGKRREIEAYLRLWRIRIRAIWRFFDTPFFPLVVGVFGLVLFLSIFSPFCRFVSYIPGWYYMFQGAILAGWAFIISIFGSYATLLFLAETAKADLEKSDVRRSFVEMQRNRARRSPWWALWILEALSAVPILAGIWLLQPRSESVMQAPHVIPVVMHVGVSEIVLGALMGLIVFWLIMVKRKSERTDPG